MGILKIFSKPVSIQRDEFNKLYAKYYSVVYKNIYYLTGDAYASEDLAQEAFIKLFNDPPGHPNVAAWLNKVATNLSYNYIRNQRLRINKDSQVVQNIDEAIITIEEQAIKNYELTLTRKVLNTMLPRDKMCLLLKFSGYKYHEIAAIVGIDKGSVGTILARAQEKFRNAYLKLEKRGEIL